MWAFDEATGEIELKEVLQTTDRECDHTIELHTAKETIETTAEHPFSTTNGWKDAADLEAGDRICTRNDETIEITKTEFKYEQKRVYNFEVAEWHTYFVGALAWLVHNATKCATKIVKDVSKRLKYLGRTPGKSSKMGKEVFERMINEGEARIRKVGKKEIKEFYDPDNKVWRNIKDADMGHLHDAVTYWNKTGRKLGAKSKEVRDWMLDSKNYKYEYYRTNRSRGAKLKEGYLPPSK